MPHYYENQNMSEMPEIDAKKRRFHRGDQRLLIAFASGLSIRKAAQEAGVSEKTAERRMNHPDFRRDLDAIRSKMLDAAIGRLASSMTAAAVTLKRLLTANSEMARLSAARSILELACRLKEASDLEARLTRLEESAKGRR
jgi:hypothetical protein